MERHDLWHDQGTGMTYGMTNQSFVGLRNIKNRIALLQAFSHALPDFSGFAAVHSDLVPVIFGSQNGDDCCAAFIVAGQNLGRAVHSVSLGLHGFSRKNIRRE